MKIFLIFIFCVMAYILKGQDTTYLDNDWNKVSSPELSKYYKIDQRDKIDTNKAKVTIYYRSGQIKSENNYSVFKKGILDGKHKEWYENGQLHMDIDYKDGNYNGQILSYWENGIPKRTDNYENGKLINGKCFNSDGSDTIYYDFEKKPEFPGGEEKLLRYISEEAKYPENARDNGIEGKVFVGFVINRDGTVTDVKIVRGVDKDLDNESIRVVKSMPRWKPGMQDGETVRVSYVIPINFRLDKSIKESKKRKRKEIFN